MSIEEKINYANKMFLENNDINHFDKLYSSTTENSDYIKYFDMTGKLLTIGSSSDQVFNAIFYDCEDITVLDISPFTAEYFYLQKASMIISTYELYFKKYNNTVIPNYNSYEKIRDVLGTLSKDSLQFWDNLYSNYTYEQIKKTLFHTSVFQQQFNQYLIGEENYNITKAKVLNINPKFIIADIFTIDKLNIGNKYTSIFLSNLFDYYKNNQSLRKFIILLDILKDLLNNDGKILISYLYGQGKDKSIKELKRYFEKIGIDYSSIKKVYNKAIDSISKRTDAVAIYQKKM